MREEEKAARTPLCERLDLIKADSELVWSCAKYILKKKHHRAVRKVNPAYIDQIAYTTTLVISYGRIFGTSHGWPEPISQEKIEKIYDNEEKALHKKLIRLRNKLYAHSDRREYLHGGHHMPAELPALFLTEEQVERIVQMSEKLMAALERIKQAACC